MIGVRLSKKEYNSSKEHSSVLISSPDHTNLLFTIEYNEFTAITECTCYAIAVIFHRNCGKYEEKRSRIFSVLSQEFAIIS